MLKAWNSVVEAISECWQSDLLWVRRRIFREFWRWLFRHVVLHKRIHRSKAVTKQNRGALDSVKENLLPETKHVAIHEKVGTRKLRKGASKRSRPKLFREKSETVE